MEHEETPETRGGDYVRQWGRVGVTHSVFEATPATGTFYPSSSLSFQIRFSPLDSVHYRGRLRLWLGQMPAPRPLDAPPAAADLVGEGFGGAGGAYVDREICTLNLSGQGGECLVHFEPRVVSMAQRLSVGKVYGRSLLLRNLSRARTTVSWEKYPDLLYQVRRLGS